MTSCSGLDKEAWDGEDSMRPLALCTLRPQWYQRHRALPTCQSAPCRSGAVAIYGAPAARLFRGVRHAERHLDRNRCGRGRGLRAATQRHAYGRTSAAHSKGARGGICMQARLLRRPCPPTSSASIDRLANFFAGFPVTSDEARHRFYIYANWCCESQPASLLLSSLAWPGWPGTAGRRP